MNQPNLLANEINTRLELYSELQKGLQAIEQGQIKTSDEVRKHMEDRRKLYLHAKI